MIQNLTLIKCIFSNARYSCRDRNRPEAKTSRKCIVTNACYACGNREALQFTAVVEHTPRYFIHSLWERNIGQKFTTTENAAFEVRHAGRDRNARDFAAFLERSRADPCHA